MTLFPELPYAGTSGHSGSDTSRERAERDDRSGVTGKRQRQVLARLAAVGAYGQTWKDLADLYGWHHGQASGVLSVLHKTGHVERLTARRDRCHVYVLPAHVHGLPTEPHGGKPKTCPHCGGSL